MKMCQKRLIDTERIGHGQCSLLKKVAVSVMSRSRPIKGQSHKALFGWMT